jgi:hypothetical protein
MRTLLLGLTAAAMMIPLTATPANARPYGYGAGYGGSYEVRQERRECRRELRRADSRREYYRELRECRREIARAKRDRWHDRGHWRDGRRSDDRYGYGYRDRRGW